MTTKRTLKSIGAKLRRERKDAGLTQAEVAAEIGTKKQHVSRIERGADFQISTLYRLCRALGTRPCYVLPDFKISNEPPF